MNKQDPSCQSTEIYRRHLPTLKLCGDNCNYKWKAQPVLSPILRNKFWLSKPFKGWHYVEVWRSPSKPLKFA
jgi:hypothetical protein